MEGEKLSESQIFADSTDGRGFYPVVSTVDTRKQIWCFLNAPTPAPNVDLECDRDLNAAINLCPS